MAGFGPQASQAERPKWGRKLSQNMVERYVFVVKVVAPTTWSARNGNIRSDYLP